MTGYKTPYYRSVYACAIKKAKDFHDALEAVRAFNACNLCEDADEENVKIEDSLGFVLYEEDVFLEFVNFGRRRQTYNFLRKTTQLNWLFDDNLPNNWNESSELVEEAFNAKEATSKFYKLLEKFSTVK